jgi:hypothetical protein
MNFAVCAHYTRLGDIAVKCPVRSDGAVCQSERRDCKTYTLHVARLPLINSCSETLWSRANAEQAAKILLTRPSTYVRQMVYR